MKTFKPEEWCMIPGFKYYQVSSHGRVKSLSRIVKLQKSSIFRRIPELILKFKIDKKGYHRVSLRSDYGTFTKLVRQLVAEAFIPNPKNLTEVNHKTGDPSENYYKDLEWCTHKENMEHASSTGLLKQWKQGIIQVLEDGTEVCFDSIREASRKTGISKTGIEYNLKTDKVMRKYKCNFKKGTYELK